MNGTCEKFFDPLDLTLPQSSPFPSLLQHKPLLHQNQQHMYERFGFKERDSGKSKQGN